MSIFDSLRVRASQGKQYITDLRGAVPKGFRGRPAFTKEPCAEGCEACRACCPTQAITLAHGYGFEETLDVPQLVEEWKAAKKRWRATRTEVRNEPGYMAEGPIPVPSPTSKVR